VGTETLSLRLELKKKGTNSGGGGGGGGDQALVVVDLDGSERMIGGSLASMVGTALSHPVDTLRSRVTSTGMRMSDAWSGLIQREGPRALWKGLGANMVRVAPYGAINFFVYDWCKSVYRQRFLGPGERMGAAPTLVFGGLAGAAAQTVVYPLEMVQRRIQVQGMASVAKTATTVTAVTAKKAAAVAAAAGTTSSSAFQYKNMFHGIVFVARSEGIGALYAGLVPNYAKIFPAAAVSFYVYEVMKAKFGIL